VKLPVSFVRVLFDSFASLWGLLHEVNNLISGLTLHSVHLRRGLGAHQHRAVGLALLPRLGRAGFGLLRARVLPLPPPPGLHQS
jgi:hypothetical protein